MAEEKYNLKNSAVKRILQEVKEMQSNPSDDFMSLPLEENIFEWQFAISGPRDTEFEGGIYHGRIQLPAEYPFKPPAFMLFSPNGRFETQTKICLSISNHHPEHWQPSWSGIIEGDSGVCDQPDIQSESSVVRILLLVQGNSSMADDTRAAFKHIPTEGHKVMEKLAGAWGGQSGYADSEWLDTFCLLFLLWLISLIQCPGFHLLLRSLHLYNVRFILILSILSYISRKDMVFAGLVQLWCGDLTSMALALLLLY